MKTSILFRLGKILIASLFVSVSFSVSVHAATCYWVGSAAPNNNWNDAGNWSSSSGGTAATCDGGANVPDSDDTVVFDTGSTVIPNLQTAGNISVSAFTILTGYNGTIDFDTYDNDLTVANTLTINSGELSFDDQTLSIRSLDLDAGDLTAPSGTMNVTGNFTVDPTDSTFTHNSGTVAFNGTSATFINMNGDTVVLNNLTIDKTGLGEAEDVEFGTNDDNLQVNGTLNLNDGDLWYTSGVTGAKINSRGSVTWGANFNTLNNGDGLISFEGTGDNDFSLPAGAQIPSINIDNPNLTITTTGTSTVTTHGTFTVADGIFNNSGNASMTIDGVYTQTGGIFNAGDAGLIHHDQAVYLNGGTYDGQTADEIRVGPYYEMELNGGTFDGEDVDLVELNGSNTLDSLDLNSGTFEAPGTNKTLAINSHMRIENGGFNENGGILKLDGDYQATIDLYNNALTVNSLVIEKTFNVGLRDEVTLADGDVLTVTGTLRMRDGEFNGGTGGAKIISQGAVQWLADFLGGPGIVNFTTTGENDFTLPDGGSLTGITNDNSNMDITAAGTYAVDGAFTLNAGSFDANQTTGTSSFASTFTQTGGAFTAGSPTNLTHTGRVDLDGGTYNAETATEITFSNLLDVAGGAFNGSTAGTLDLNGNILITSYYQSLRMTSGSFTANSGTMELYRGLDTSAGGTFNANGGTINMHGNYNASINMDSGQSLNNLSIYRNGPGLREEHFVFSSLDIDGNFDMLDGEFILNNNDITLYGDWDMEAAGRLTAGNGKVSLDGGNQTIEGNTTFYDFEKLTNSTLYFTAGSTTTITGTWTLTGTGSNPIHLRSTVDGTYWYVNPSNYDLDYISVKDSTNNGGTIFLSGKNADDIGPQTNVNWDFTGANPLPVVAPIPEFSTWLLILTMMIGMGMIYQKKELLFERN